MSAEGIAGLVTAGLVRGWWLTLPAVALFLAGWAGVAGRARKDVHWRGTRVVPALRLRRAVAPDPRGHVPITLAGVRIRAADECKHFKLIGTTGTGKSTAIRELLAAALRRGDRAVITDPDGGYLERFHQRYRGDVILNPFEGGSLRWDPFAELRDPYDVEQLASGLIPAAEDPAGREWRAYARTLICALVRRCRDSTRPDVGELWRLIAIASSQELRPIVAGTAAQPFLEPENARMLGSIRSIAGSATAALEHVQRQRTACFSVRRWVREGRGVLFVPYSAGQIAALRSIIATWMRLAIFEAMGRPSPEQRLWIVVDELDALGAIDGLKDALARLRKFGGRCVLGFQSIAQVSSTYGAGEAQTIVENCGNTLILRCAGSEHGGTSQFASRLIGEREVLRRQTSRGRDRLAGFSLRAQRRSVNVSEQQVSEMAVLASELEQLPDLTGYLKTASGGAWRQVALRREPPRRGAER
jgi:type IV secretory pathway TraG/TraD family ATPase VirD4